MCYHVAETMALSAKCIASAHATQRAVLQHFFRLINARASQHELSPPHAGDNQESSRKTRQGAVVRSFWPSEKREWVEITAMARQLVAFTCEPLMLSLDGEKRKEARSQAPSRYMQQVRKCSDAFHQKGL